jgi:hypothetical protein
MATPALGDRRSRRYGKAPPQTTQIVIEAFRTTSAEMLLPDTIGFSGLIQRTLACP